jgi:hypothetical protein
VSELFYALDPIVMGIMLTNILQHVYGKAKRERSGTHWEIWGPVWYVFIANVLCMLMPMATVFIYIGKVGYPGSKLWKNSDWFPNTPLGIIFYLAKWVGTGFLMAGVIQISGLHTKIMARWRELRGQDALPTVSRLKSTE